MTQRKIAARVKAVGAIFAAVLSAASSAQVPGTRAPAVFSEPRGESDYRAPAHPDTLIRHATVLDGAGKRFTGDILIRKGRIAAVGPALEAAGAIEIEAAGRFVTPGIVDIHTHYGTFPLPQTADESDNSDLVEKGDFNAADTWIEHAVRAADPAFSRALAGGVTTLQVLPGSSVLIAGRSVILKPLPAVTASAMRFPGAPRGLKLACGSNALSEDGASSRQGQIALLRKTLLDTQRYIASWTAYRGGKTTTEPARDLRLESLAAVFAGQAPVHVHCYRADDMATWISVFDEFGIKVSAFHHASEAYKIAPLLAKKGICAAVWPDWWGFKREAEDAIPENAAFVHAAGGCAIMHSDIPVLGSLLAIETAKAAAAGRRTGLPIPPEQAIRWITSNPARAIGLGDRIGTLAPGMNADLVIWSADPFSIYAHADRVYIDGALAYDRAAGARPSDFELGRPQRGGAR